MLALKPFQRARDIFELSLNHANIFATDDYYQFFRVSLCVMCVCMFVENIGNLILRTSFAN